MEKFNETQPQDGNQVVINKNTGTVTINNHSKNNDATLERLFNQIHINNDVINKNNNVIESFSKTVIDMIEREVNKMKKRKSK